MKNKWSADDRQRFADRDVLRASSVPARRFDGPHADEWHDELREMRSR